MDNTQNFSGLANDYAIGRPTYSNQLLDKGSFVYCIEPNDDMRKIAIEELGRYKNFHAVDELQQKRS